MSELRCDKCKLYKTSCVGTRYSAVKIEGAGNFDSEILLVGEAPGATEVIQKKPFVGDSGKLLRRYLQSVGISEKNAFFTNVCRCRPPENRTPIKSEIKACLPYLEEEIQKMKPKVIGALGNTSCRALGVEGKITGIHGAKIWSEKFNCWIVPIYHPSYVKRFTNESRQRGDFVTDLGLLTQLTTKVAKKEKTIYKVADTIKKVEKAVSYLSKQDWFSFDLETTRYDPLNSKIICISFSSKPQTAIVIPYQHPKVFNEKQQKKVKELLVALFSSKTKKIAQNGKFDIEHLLSHNIPIRVFAFDTMLAHHLLDETGVHNLDILTATYTDMPQYKKEIDKYMKDKNEDGTNKLLEAPLNLLYDYAAKDADATIRVKLQLEKLLIEEKLINLFYKIVIPLTYVLANMELEGIGVDKKYVAKTVVQFKYELKELENDLKNDKWVQIYKEKYKTDVFNFKSPKQLRELLYDVIGLKVIKRTKPTKSAPKGNPSTDADTLKDLAETTKIQLLERMIDFRKLKKLQDYIVQYGELAEKSLDGRVHTQYLQRGTKTGRLSSNNPNLQNIPSVDRDPKRAKLVRNCLVAKEGHTLIEGDYSQIEFRIWADNSQDEKMLKFVNDSTKDIQKQIASVVYSIPYDKVTKNQRALAKETVYGLMYGRGIWSIAREYGISEGEAQRISNGFFSEFPKAATWIEDNIQFVKDNGYLRNMFGRKRRLDDIYSTDKRKIAYAERQSRNFPIQSGAADLIYIAMTKLFRTIRDTDMRMLLQIHDSIVVEVPDSKVKEACGIIKEVMGNAVELKAPLEVGFKVGKKFGEMVDFDI